MFRRRSVAAAAAGLMLAVGGCGGGDGKAADLPGKGAAESAEGAAESAAAQPPSAELVDWVGDMCEATNALEDARTDSTAGLKKVRNPDGDSTPADFRASGYLSDTSGAVEDVQRDLDRLDSSGVPAADRLLAAWQKKLKVVGPEAHKLFWDADFDDYEKNAPAMDKLVQSLTSPQPDLTALTEKDTRLADARRRAEKCAPDWKPPAERVTPVRDPSKPLPKATDGTNTDACDDGECEILVTSEADITMNGLTVHVTVDENAVTLQAGGAVSRMGGEGGGAVGEVGSNGKDLTAVVVAHNKHGAVLYISES